MGVKVSVKTTKNITKDMLKNIGKLNSKSIEVGVLTGEHKWLAGIHEYGANIVAKNAKYLTVPVHPDAVGKSASSFSDLFFIQSKKGNKFLARKTGGGGLELIYWLTPSVNIPERSFLRAGHDEYINEVLKKTEKVIGLVVEGKMSQEQYLNMVGQMLASKIKTFARNLSSPPNSSTANTFIANYDSSTSTAQEYSTAFNSVYKMAETGVSVENIASRAAGARTVLGEKAFNAAINAGRNTAKGVFSDNTVNETKGNGQVKHSTDKKAISTKELREFVNENYDVLKKAYDIMEKFNALENEQNNGLDGGDDIDSVDKQGESGIIKLKRTVNRREKNIGAFSNLEVPMQKKAVLNACKKYNINTSGLTFKIQRSEKMLALPFYGSTDYNNIGRIDLFPNAFTDEEQLIKTVLHEKCHVLQLQKYNKKYTQEHLADMEKQAYRFEDLYYFILKKKV